MTSPREKVSIVDPIWTALLAVTFADERVTRWHFLAVLICCGGVLLVA